MKMVRYVRFSAVAYCRTVYDLKINTAYIPRQNEYKLQIFPTAHNQPKDKLRKPSRNDDVEEKGVRAYDQSLMEIALRARQFFEQERFQHRPISLNDVIERTTLATGNNKNLICKVRTLEEIKHWKKKPDAPKSVQQTSHIPENFSSITRHVIHEIYLDGRCVLTLDIILDKLLHKRVQDFEHLDLFHGREIPSLSSSLWVQSRTSLYRFMKLIGFIYGDRIFHYEYTKNRADV